jgi:uncharacterized protein (TIGR02231 family)
MSGRVWGMAIKGLALRVLQTAGRTGRGQSQCLRSIAAIAGLAFGQLPGTAFATDLVAELRIDQVTVYPEGAAITRHGPLEIPAGEHRLIVRGLPSSLDEDALRVEIGSKGVRLGDVQLRKITQADYVVEGERQLQKKLEALNDQRSAIEDEVATAQTQLKILDSLASVPTGPAARPAVDATNLSTVITAVGTSSASARARIRDASMRQRALDAQIATVRADIKKIGTQRKDSYELHAVLEASAAVSTTISVSYRIGDAGWHFLYDARLDTTSKHVALTRQASVEQGSGEDWNNIALTLTTAQPEGKVSTPDLISLFLDLAPPPQPARFARTESMADAAAAPAAPALEEVSVTGARRTVSIAATEYAAEYSIPGHVSLHADREPHLYAIGEDDFAVDLVARAVPSVSRSAFLEATFKFEREVPWGAGELQLYRDGAFVGAANTPGLLPGADIRLPFGADDRIRIESHDEPAQSGTRGILGGQMVEEHRRNFDVTSFHGAPIVLELIDRIPVSQNAAIKVEYLKDATPATTRDLDGKTGILLWKLKLTPRERATVKQHYSVGYPKGQRVAQSEGETGS